MADAHNVLRQTRLRSANPLHYLLSKCAYDLQEKAVAAEESYRRSTTDILPEGETVNNLLSASSQPINGPGFSDFSVRVERGDRAMPIRRGHNGRRSSEGDVALMQMQIAAQARNQHWHDFLCSKRDELQARLRQQGYSQSGLSGARRREPDISPGVQGVHSDGPSSASTRWGLPEAEADSTLDTDKYQPESRAPLLPLTNPTKYQF